MKIDLKTIKLLEIKLAGYSKENGTIAEHESVNVNCSSGCSGTCQYSCTGTMNTGCGTCQSACWGSCLGTCQKSCSGTCDK